MRVAHSDFFELVFEALIKFLASKIDAAGFWGRALVSANQNLNFTFIGVYCFHTRSTFPFASNRSICRFTSFSARLFIFNR